ncbi:hypothetical protein ACWD7M_16885 [Streptomyces griseus]
MKTLTSKGFPFCVGALAVLLPVSWIWQAFNGFENQLRLGFTIAMTLMFVTLLIGSFLSWASKRRAEGDELAKARPVNPGAPPHYQTLVRIHGDPETRCTCHDRPLADGETVLVWPGPDALLCQETHRNEATP